MADGAADGLKEVSDRSERDERVREVEGEWGREIERAVKRSKGKGVRACEK